MNFILKQFDKSLMTFFFEQERLDGQVCKILYIDEENKSLLPLGMEVTDEGLLSWLRTRVIPKNREFVEQILSRFGLTQKNTLGIIQVCKGLSLNDCYWIVEEGFDGMFDKYNLYDNSFQKALSLIAYTGYGSSNARGFASSPEFTTNGMLKKSWRRLNKKIFLYKGGTSGAVNAGKEPYSEYYASEIATRMGLHHVAYDLKKWKGEMCSTCELFTSKDVSYVPIHRFVKRISLVEISNYLKTLGEDYYNEFADMMVFDALIYNTDRHAGNFGLLIDNKTNKPIGLAPIFDNGLSLFNYAMGEELDNLKEYSKSRLSAFGVSYEEIVQYFISDRQREQLRRMINFKFVKHPQYNLPSERLKKLETFLQERVQELLKIK